MPVPQRGRDRRGAASSKAQRGAARGSGIDGEVIVADNGSTDGSPEIAAAAGARVVRGRGARLRQRAAGRDRGRARALRASWATPTTATTSRDLEPFVEQLRAGDDLVMGNRFAGGIEPGAMPCAAPLPRQPGAVGHRPAVLPQRRSATSTAACAASARDADAAPRAADDGHGVRERDGREGDAARPAHQRGADDARARTAAAARRTCAAGATAGGTCASCCCTARAGCSCYPGVALMRAGLALGGWLLPGPRIVGASSSTSTRCCTRPPRSTSAISRSRLRCLHEGLRGQRGTAARGSAASSGCCAGSRSRSGSPRALCSCCWASPEPFARSRTGAPAPSASSIRPRLCGS